MNGEEDVFLPGLPVARIRACYEAAPGNELASGKFANPESSAALVANAFGYFLDRPGDLPVLPRMSASGWPASDVALEKCMRFPWSGGTHPYLDVVVETQTHLIGIESKRFEPLRDKPHMDFSDAYWRPVWGDAMRRYEAVRDDLAGGKLVYAHLSACQLVKHAFGLRTQAGKAASGRIPVLYYLYAEPARWTDGRNMRRDHVERHGAEIRDFTARVAGDEVLFLSCGYGELLGDWSSAGSELAGHAGRVLRRFAPAPLDGAPVHT